MEEVTTSSIGGSLPKFSTPGEFRRSPLGHVYSRCIRMNVFDIFQDVQQFANSNKSKVFVLVASYRLLNVPTSLPRLNLYIFFAYNIISPVLD